MVGKSPFDPGKLAGFLPPPPWEGPPLPREMLPKFVADLPKEQKTFTSVKGAVMFIHSNGGRGRITNEKNGQIVGVDFAHFNRVRNIRHPTEQTAKRITIDERKILEEEIVNPFLRLVGKTMHGVCHCDVKIELYFHSERAS